MKKSTLLLIAVFLVFMLLLAAWPIAAAMLLPVRWELGEAEPEPEPPPQNNSALAQLAASMQPGTWTALNTAGAVAAFTGSGGSTGIVTPYATFVPYDPVTKTVHFIGMDHMGAALNEFSLRHVVYSVSSNAFTHTVPPYFPPGLPNYNDSHGYQRTSIDPVSRRLFRTPGGDPVRVFALDDGGWSTLPGPPEGSYGSYYSGFFPDRNSLIMPTQSGQAWERNLTTNTWGSIAGYDTPGTLGQSTWGQLLYNPVLKQMLWQDSAQTAGTINAAGVFTRLNPLPANCATYVGAGNNGLIVPDVSGKYILMNDPLVGEGREVFEYDSVAQTCIKLANQPPDKHMNNQSNWVASVLPEFGVTMWIWAQGGSGASAGVYLYKHTSGNDPPALMTFAQKCAQPGVMSCVSFDAQSDIRYVYSQNTNPCMVDAGVQPNHRFSQDRLAGEANAVTTIIGSRCVYPVVDTGTRHSGEGSLRFEIPSQSHANTSGNFTLPFGGLGDKRFIGPMSNPAAHANVVYFQFRQRVDNTFLTTPYIPGGGWKQVILYGNPPLGSNSSGMEVTMVNGYMRGLPAMYGQQGADDYGVQDVRGCVYTGGPASTYTEPPCIRYKPDVFTEYTVAIAPGPKSCYGAAQGKGDTRVRMWVDGQLAVENMQACVTYPGDGDGFGQFILTPFQTGKDETQIHPVAFTWYDDVVISTQPVQMANGALAAIDPVPATPIPPTEPPTEPPPTGNNTPPVITGLGSYTANPGDSLTVTANITDDALPGQALNVLWSVSPAGPVLQNPTYSWGPMYGNPVEPGVAKVYGLGVQIPVTVTPGAYALTLSVSDLDLTTRATATLTVGGVPAPAPSITLMASPSTILAGETATLTWSSLNATTVTLNGVTTGVTGSQSVKPEVTTAYTAIATGPGGTATSSAAITVNQPVPPQPGDIVAPSVSFKTQDGSSFSANVKTIEFRASDNVGVVLCEPTVNGVKIQATPIFTEGAKLPAIIKFYLQQATIPKGTYILGVSCKDAAGNIGTAQTISVTRK